MNLGFLTIRAALWIYLANFAQQGLSFLFFVAMARLLEPSAFGLMALALVFVEVLLLIGRGGLIETAVQRAEISDTLQNELFWWLQAKGLLMTVAVWFAAAPAGQAFGHPELVPALRCLSPVCWLANCSAVPEARLQRAFGQERIARSRLRGMVAGGAAGLTLAFLGFGVLSLVFQKLVATAVESVLLWLAQPWRPGAPPLRLGEDLREMLRSGLNLLSADIVITVNGKFMDVLVGLFLGPTILGYLRTAWRSFEFVAHCCADPLVKVSYVTFGRLKDDPDALIAAYKRMVEVASLVILPSYFGLAAVAPVAVPLLFGPQWRPAAELVQALSLAAIATAFDPFFLPMMSAGGHSRRFMPQATIHMVLSVALTAAATPFGAVAAIGAQVARATIMSGVGLWMLRKDLGIPFKTSLFALRPALVSAGLMALVVAVILRSFGGVPLGWAHLAALVASGVLVYVGGLLLFFRHEMSDLWQAARAILSAPFTPAASRYFDSTN